MSQKPGSKFYRKSPGTDSWHFCVNCPNWPDFQFVEWPSAESPPDNLCLDCLEQDRRGSCQRHTAIYAGPVKKILLIEDHADVRRVLSLALRRAGYETAEAADAAAGIDKSLTENPDLILMDISLPDSGGLETARRIKENPRTQRIPIVACSGWKNDDLIAKAAESGIAEFMIKPISLEALVKVIEKLT